MSGTARTRSFAKATACSAHTLSTTGVTNRWGTPGTISTLLLSGVRRSGRTRQRATLRRRPTSGGDGTTSTATTKPPPKSTNRSAGAAQLHWLATPRNRAVQVYAKLHTFLLIYDNLWLKRNNSHWRSSVSLKRRELGFMPLGPIPRNYRSGSGRKMLRLVIWSPTCG